MIFVQAPPGLYQTNPTAVLAYSSPNTAGNLGLAWCYCSNGLLPGTITDSNGNVWCFGNANQHNTQSISVFICMSLKAGSNTVTAIFGTLSGIDVSLHIEEYSYTSPVAIVAMQSYFAINPFATFSWGIFGGYTWGTNPWRILHYYNSLASNVQRHVTVTCFLGLYDSVAPPHGWGSGGNGIVRSETEQSQGSTVSGNYTVATSTQRIFEPNFGIIYPTGPQNQPQNVYTGLVLIEF